MTRPWFRDLARFIAVVTLLGSAIAFFVERWEEKDRRERDSKRAFLELQLDTYAKAVDILSDFANEPGFPGQSWPPKLRGKLNQLLAGRLPLVWDTRFRIAMKIADKAKSDNMDSPCSKEIHLIAETVTQCARQSIAGAWGFEVGPNECIAKLQKLGPTCGISDAELATLTVDTSARSTR